MLDGYGRNINYLRISITDKCNLRCRYCMPCDITSLPMSKILSYEEVELVASVAAKLGIDTVRITGGEPLVRRDCCDLVKKLKGICGIKRVYMTSNGVLLADNAKRLSDAGLDGINISLDTLNKKRYALITGSDCLERVLDGVDAAIREGIPVKLNAVSLDMRALDEGCEKAGLYSDVFDLTEYAARKSVDVRFIEMMPIGYGKDFPAIPHGILIDAVKERYPEMEPDDGGKGSGPAVYYKIPGRRSRIGFISAIHNTFCEGCNRIRLTTQGFLKSCLCYDEGVDLKSIIRSHLSEDQVSKELEAAIREAISCKPKAHSFTDREKISEKHIMSRIGG